MSRNVPDIALLESEECRPVRGYPGYFVTSFGRVLSQRCRSGRIRADGQVHALAFDRNPKNDTNRVTLSRDGVTRRFLVSTLVAHAFINEPHRNRNILHLDGDHTNNRADNLRYGTLFEQYALAVAIPTVVHGIENHKSKLNPDKVRQIRKLVAQGETCADIGRHFGVSNVAIAMIRDGRSWVRVDGEPSILPTIERHIPALRSDAKLNPSKVRRIRRLLAEGQSYTSIAARFGVTGALVGMIRSGRAWASVSHE